MAPQPAAALPAAEPPAYKHTYTTTSQWSNGFIGDYTITNTGSAPLTNWQAQFALPSNESISSVWNANLAQSGTQYTLTPASWTQTIAPGGSITIGFQVTQTGTYSPPTHLVVNGVSTGGGTTTGGTGTGNGGGTTGGGTGTGGGAEHYGGGSTTGGTGTRGNRSTETPTLT